MFYVLPCFILFLCCCCCFFVVVFFCFFFVFCFFVCFLLLFFFSHFSVAIASLEEERASLGAFRTFVRFALVWFCLFLLPLGVWEGLRFVIVALPGRFAYFFFFFFFFFA